jgi:Tol biopolymer transport system component
VKLTVGACCFNLAPLALLTAAVTTPQAATARPAAALLTFSSRYGVCLAHADGSHRLRLFPTGRNPGSQPSWSPNGRYLIVGDSRPDPNRKFGVVERVRVVTPAGRVVATLMEADRVTGFTWSPDGRWVAIGTASRGGGIGIVRPDGSDWRGVVASQTTELFSPTWQPDAQAFAFYGQVGTSSTPGISRIQIDGSGLRFLVRWARQPSYSPDGARLAYVYAGDIYIANAADGSDAHALKTTSATLESSPAWSPGGKLIAFVRHRSGRRGGSIVTIRPNGTGERVVIPYRYAADIVTWRPPVARPAPSRPRCR